MSLHLYIDNKKTRRHVFIRIVLNYFRRRLLEKSSSIEFSKYIDKDVTCLLILVDERRQNEVIYVSFLSAFKDNNHYLGSKKVVSFDFIVVITVFYLLNSKS